MTRGADRGPRRLEAHGADDDHDQGRTTPDNGTTTVDGPLDLLGPRPPAARRSLDSEAISVDGKVPARRLGLMGRSAVSDPSWYRLPRRIRNVTPSPDFSRSGIQSREEVSKLLGDRFGARVVE